MSLLNALLHLKSTPSLTLPPRDDASVLHAGGAQARRQKADATHRLLAGSAGGLGGKVRLVDASNSTTFRQPELEVAFPTGDEGICGGVRCDGEHVLAAAGH